MFGIENKGYQQDHPADGSMTQPQASQPLPGAGAPLLDTADTDFIMTDPPALPPQPPADSNDSAASEGSVPAEEPEHKIEPAYPDTEDQGEAVPVTHIPAPAAPEEPQEEPEPQPEPTPEPPTEPAEPEQEEPAPDPAPAEPSVPAAQVPAASDDLMLVKQQALQNLSPIVHLLDQTPEEKFRTTMMLLQSTDDQSLVAKAHEAALAITDDKVRAQALLDVVNEVNYFTHKNANQD